MYKEKGIQSYSIKRGYFVFIFIFIKKKFIIYYFISTMGEAIFSAYIFKIS